LSLRYHIYTSGLISKRSTDGASYLEAKREDHKANPEPVLM